MAARIIGLTGQNGSGKGTVAEILKGLGYSYVSLSDMIREEATRRGEGHDRQTLTALGNELRAAHGHGVLGNRVVGRIGAAGGTWAVDSIRHPAEVDALRTLEGFTLWRITAPIETRFARAIARGRVEGVRTLEEFQRENGKENAKAGDAVQHIEDCEQLADTTVENDGTIEELRSKVLALVGRDA